MKTMLRKLRGLLGTAVIWGLGWFGLSGAYWGVTLFGDVTARLLMGVAIGFGVAGALCGAGFSLVLGVAERKHTFDELSYRRLATWGALGGLLLGGPLLVWMGLGSDPRLFAMLAGFGSASAAGTLALARRADDAALLPRDRSSPTLGP